MDIKEIFIEWDGPYTYEELVLKKDQNNRTINPDDSGIYQIYGAHPVYGNDVLLYIGKTEQGFFKRLKNRGIITDNFDEKNIKIYLGRLFYDKAFNENIKLDKDISIAESLLIYYHKPSHNSSNINSITLAQKNIIVYNIGNRRSLHNTISTCGFINEYKIYSFIDNLKEELNIEEENYYNEEDGYGFFLDKEQDIWIGIDYSLWNEKTTLVLITNTEKAYSKISNIVNNEAFHNIEKYDPKFPEAHYLSINSKDNNELLDLLKKINDYAKK